MGNSGGDAGVGFDVVRGHGDGPNIGQVLQPLLHVEESGIVGKRHAVPVVRNVKGTGQVVGTSGGLNDLNFLEGALIDSVAELIVGLNVKVSVVLVPNLVGSFVQAIVVLHARLANGLAVNGAQARGLDVGSEGRFTLRRCGYSYCQRGILRGTVVGEGGNVAKVFRGRSAKDVVRWLEGNSEPQAISYGALSHGDLAYSGDGIERTFDHRVSGIERDGGSLVSVENQSEGSRGGGSSDFNVLYLLNEVSVGVRCRHGVSNCRGLNVLVSTVRGSARRGRAVDEA